MATLTQYALSTITQPAPSSTNQADPILIPKTLRYMPLHLSIDLDPSTNATVTTQTPPRPVPCRRCLKDSTPGDVMLLVSYDPFQTGNTTSFDSKSPYAARSPVYVHADTSICRADDFPVNGGGILPEQQRKRLLSVRAYDKNDMIREAVVVQGYDLVRTCEELLVTRRDEVGADYVNVHYAGPGCFAVRVEPTS